MTEEATIIGMAQGLEGRHATSVTEDIWRVVNGCRGQACKARYRINHLDRLERRSVGRSGEGRNSGWRCIADFGEPSLEEADSILVPG